MKKMLPIRGYYLRAKIFGYIVVAISLFSILYYLNQLLEITKVSF